MRPILSLSKLKMSFKSILEEHKVGKGRLLISMLEKSEDPIVKEATMKMETVRECKVKQVA